MKNLWKFAAALVAIAGSVVLIARYGDKFLAKLQELRDRCCCGGGCSCGEKLADAACAAGEAVEETVEHVAQGAEEVAEAVEEATEEAVETVQEAAEAVTEEDFAD